MNSVDDTSNICKPANKIKVPNSGVQTQQIKRFRSRTVERRMELSKLFDSFQADVTRDEGNQLHQNISSLDQYRMKSKEEKMKMLKHVMEEQYAYQRNNCTDCKVY